MQVTQTRTIKRLYYDCGYKTNSSYRCNVCNFRVNEHMAPNDKYDKSRHLICEHLIETHPDFCSTCPKCDLLFASKKDLAYHMKEHRKLS